MLFLGGDNITTFYLKKEFVKLLVRPRRTTLFVLQWMNEKSMNHKNVVLRRIETLLVSSSKPRILILNSFSLTHECLNTTLHSLWLYGYLDVTILTYNQERQLKLKTNSRNLPFLSRVNPFTGEYSTQEVSSDFQWFPDKLQDLNGYELNFELISLSKIETRRRNLEIEFPKIMAQAMNFKLSTEARQENVYHEMEKEFSEYPLEYTGLRILKFNKVKAVIPKAVKLTKVADVSPEFWYMFLLTIGSITIIRLTAFFLKFKKCTWQTLNISQIIIGMPSAQEPENLTGRVIFGSLLIVCLVYSGYFYSVILDITLRSEPEISSLAELFNSSLTLMMDLSLKYALQRNNGQFSQRLAKRSIDIPSRRPQMYCLKYLANHKNVSCILSRAEYYINKYEAKYGELNVKILPEAVTNFASNWNAIGRSPFKDRFSEIILRASEFGLLEDYYAPAVQSYNTLPSKNVERDKLLHVLFYVAAIGYSLSTIAFLLEIFTASFKNKMYVLYTRFRFSN